MGSKMVGCEEKEELETAPEEHTNSGKVLGVK